MVFLFVCLIGFGLWGCFFGALGFFGFVVLVFFKGLLGHEHRSVYDQNHCVNFLFLMQNIHVTVIFSVELEFYSCWWWLRRKKAGNSHQAGRWCNGFSRQYAFLFSGTVYYYFANTCPFLFPQPQ